MQHSAIRHLAVCDRSCLAAAALFERTVQIWSWATGQQLGEFDTVLDFGGRRLAVSPGGTICIAGSWSHGLAAYSIPDGTVLWHRTDIKRIRRVRLRASGRQIYCGVEGSSVHIVAAGTGEPLGEERGVRDIVDSSNGSHELIVQKDRYVVRGESGFEISPLSFALLDAAFSPHSVCLSEPKNVLHPRDEAGGIRMIELGTGRVLYRLDLATGHLAFNSSDQRFYCVAYKGSAPYDWSLIRLASTLLDCDQLLALDRCWEAAFTPSGAVLVTVQGDVYETSTGAVLAHLSFPRGSFPGS